MGKPMKLIIQIPCFNEAEALPATLKDLPRDVAGFDSVEWLVINDGSTDGTVEAALNNGVNHVVSFTKNQGLARAFLAGLDSCIKLGADVIINTDADNQYMAADIPALVAPILEGRADVVIGARPIDEIRSFSLAKKMLQKAGSCVVRFVSKTNIPDAPSGFRAMTREAAMRFNVFNDYTYTLETIIQAGQKKRPLPQAPPRAGDHVGDHHLVCVAEVCLTVHIVNGCGDIKPLAHLQLLWATGKGLAREAEKRIGPAGDAIGQACGRRLDENWLKNFIARSSNKNNYPHCHAKRF